MNSQRVTQIFLFIILIFPAVICAQTTPPPPPPPAPMSISIGTPTAPPKAWTGKRGGITGRVIGEDGQPLANIGVNIVSVATDRSARRVAMTDDEGSFKLNDLPSGAYQITPFAPGYVPAEEARAPHYRLGESPTITMTKGGVITGKAFDSTGLPLVAASVLAYRVRDGEGRAIKTAEPRTARALTDDRGVYRIFGLQSGSYLVATDGSGETQITARDVATYYPNGPRDTAQEVSVTAGSEVQGIDIRHRGELGHVISGTVSGYAETGTVVGSGVVVELLQMATGYNVAVSFLSRSSNSFAIYGVADGEYEAIAYQTDAAIKRSFSTPRRVTVKGNDVTGIDLRLVGLGAIDGRLVVEKFDAPPTCQIKRRGAVEETLLTARRAEKETRPQRFSYAETLPDETGEFGLRALTAGLYRITPQLPSEHWFVKAMTLPGAASAKPPAPRAAAPKVTTINAATGVTVKNNETITGLAITIAEGAAGLSGRVEGQKLPKRMRVHLVPSEPEAATDVLRYHEVMTQDGSFALNHVSPGKYWLLARVVPDDESDEKPAKPAAWDANERTKLRREAEAAKNEIVLTSCQRVKDFALRFAGEK